MAITEAGQSFRTYKTRNNIVPPLGPVALPVKLPFESVNDEFRLDFTKTLQDRDIDIIQSVWVDNADNPNKLIIQCDQTQQRLVIPAGAQLSLPIIHPQDPRIVVTCGGNTAFAGTVQLIFQNFPVPIASWGPVDIGAVNATLTPTIAAVANFSGAVAAGGVSQIAIPANAARKRFTIQNPGNSPENIFINFTDPASGNGDSIELSPLGSYDSAFGPLDTGDITITSATGGTKYTAKEWS